MWTKKPARTTTVEKKHIRPTAKLNIKISHEKDKKITNLHLLRNTF